ncbi:TonB-dependent receptor [Sphingopyxis panaciterrulae]|uniref:TonB-dependent receptor n=1 Tax=Sphingopyxis panaciterrulae TaxID=462372 RepID=A0A7W9B271_9SPHN|nr:TonB-dependent receptor [Sphingopyxis panaciterrulae]MBB5704876.1 TonB-dependent receptor [Sphingopyxis panaciterrulae]
MSDRISLLGSTALAALMLATATPAHAQATDPANAGEGGAAADEIVVTGLRASLENAAAIKRDSGQIQDSIVAEDIGKLPDTNIAETLQRIPGVQISRNTRGEGNAYVVHGLKQVMTTVNGRQLFGTTNRVAQLLDFSSDILSGVDVYKTATADQIEGGLGGLINIHTARPFDFDGFHVALTGSATYSEFQDKAGPRISGIVSNRWQTGIGEIGVLLGAQFERYYSGGYQVSTNSYADVTNLFDVDGDGATGGSGDTVTMPTQVRPRYETGNRVRSGFYGAVQWRPSDALELHLDTIYSHSGGHSYTQQLSVQTDGATTGIDAPVFKDGSRVPAAYSLANPVVKSTVGQADNPYDTINVAFGGKYTADRFTLSAEGSYVRSHGPFYYRSATIQTRAGRADLSLAGDTPDVAVSGVDLTDPDAYGNVSYFEYGTQQDGREPSFRVDASYELDAGPIKTLEAGFRWAHHRAIYDFLSQGGGALTQPYSGINELTPDDLFTDQDVSTNQWVAIQHRFMNNAARTRALFGLLPGDPAPDPGSHYDYRETTLAGYAKAQFGFDIGALPVDGNIGLRYVRTDGEQTVLVEDENGDYQPLTGGKPYENWLPSANIRFQFTPDLFLRLAYSKAITRPDYGNLSPALLLNPISMTASGGNPALVPTKADQYDASLEYYFGKSNYVAVALFRKDVSGFIQKFYADETIDGEVYQVSRPRNSGDGKIKGFEITYQQFFDFLPGVLSGLGIQGNYTYVDSKLGVVGIDRRVPADQLSKHAYNVTGIYEKGPVSLHVSYNWRSRSIQSNNADPDLSVWNAPQESFDISATYNVNNWLSVKADMVNATVAYQNQYYGTPLQPSLANQLDRSYQIGFHVNF